MLSDKAQSLIIFDFFFRNLGLLFDTKAVFGGADEGSLIYDLVEGRELIIDSVPLLIFSEPAYWSPSQSSIYPLLIFVQF